MKARAATMRRRRNWPVVLKKEITYPHLVDLKDWLTFTKEQDVSKRLKDIKAHLAKKDVKKKTNLAGVMQGSVLHEVNAKEMAEEDLVDRISKWDSMPEIVRIKEGGEIKLYVIVQNMGPHNVNSKLTPWMKKEQAGKKEGGRLRGVEDEVIHL